MFDLASLEMPADQVEARRHFIGASDLPIIMGGEPARIHELWEFKRGGEPKDLSNAFPVMLGKFTEPFNLAFLAKRSGMAITPAEPAARGIIRASPDAIADADTYDPAVVDAKHVGPYKSEGEIGAYYAPQLFAQMYCTGHKRAILSVIKGNSDLFWLEYEWADNYGERVTSAAGQFWQHVQDGTPPIEFEMAAPPPPKGVKEYDLTGNNAWSFHAGEYVETKLAADRHEAAKKELKALVPEDASKAFGHGIIIKRDRRGALRFSEGDDK